MRFYDLRVIASVVTIFMCALCFKRYPQNEILLHMVARSLIMIFSCMQVWLDIQKVPSKGSRVHNNDKWVRDHWR